MLSKKFIKELESYVNTNIISISAVSGGDISEAFQIKTVSKTYFLKVNKEPQAKHMFEVEKSALDEISKTNIIGIPEVYLVGALNKVAYILMEYIDTKSPTSTDLKMFGMQLALLHSQPTSYFGWHQDNYIGSLHQSNKTHNNWLDFYIYERLLVQFDLVRSKGLLKGSEIPSIQTMHYTLESILRNTQPVILHGDLWRGNYLNSQNGKLYLIDPATYYGDGLVDIAMTKLFGGFGANFYKAYHKIIPKSNYYNEKIELYQLYYLLVHLNLFGASYYSSVIALLKRNF